MKSSVVSRAKNEEQLTLLKTAVSQALREQKDFLYDLIVEVIEDYALMAAIHEGRKTKFVTREEVFRTLRGKP